MSKRKPRRKSEKSSIDHLRDYPKRAYVPRPNARVFDDPLYVQWRKSVFARDNYRCRMPNCPHICKSLNAHHIKRWADYPDLRYLVTNGITLCVDCHNKVTGYEETYETMFSNILFPECATKIYRIMRGLDDTRNK